MDEAETNKLIDEFMEEVLGPPGSEQDDETLRAFIDAGIHKVTESPLPGEGA